MPPTSHLPGRGPAPDKQRHSHAPGPVEQVVRLARRQHGVVNYDQIRVAGMTRRQVRSRVDRGEWARLFQGVYRVGASPVTWEAQVIAHLLAAGPTALASHRTAAVLWGLDGFHRSTPEISVPRHRAYRRQGVRVHRSRDLHLVAPATRDHLPVTPVLRTLLDLAAVVPAQRLHVAVEDARRRDLVSWSGVVSCLATHARPGRPGVTALRQVVDDHQLDVVATENGFELLVATLLVQSGLPWPDAQHEVRLGQHVYRLDLAYPLARVAIELDGGRHMERQVFERDRPRQNALVLAGWTVLRYTWSHYRRRSGSIVREVRAALGHTLGDPG